ncbi:Hypothetical protein R9X50_00026800 [Acrodontium crateriforme]|uniref:Uncharacterized protein n=1 Tax=Acrodontium crateriforme TaxID=150365 RepID=A0AAQ3LWY3_9PEZI|nr:Hypothetical protein R9X50_00026800 [Acrodontium crateriforme]
MLAVSSLSSATGFIGDRYHQYNYTIFVYSPPSLEQHIRPSKIDPTSPNMATEVWSNYGHSHFETQGRRPVSARTVTDYSQTKPCRSMQRRDKYAGAMMIPPAVDCDVSAPSYVRSLPSLAASATHRQGFVPGTPPPDYFVSGASRYDSKMFRQAYASHCKTRPCHRLNDQGTLAMSQYFRGRQRIQELDDTDFDDSCSVAPEDSISQVSSNRTHRSKHTTRTRRKHTVVHSDDGGEALWGEDEQRYFDPVTGRWLRNVRPYFSRM